MLPIDLSREVLVQINARRGHDLIQASVNATRTSVPRTASSHDNEKDRALSL